MGDSARINSEGKHSVMLNAVCNEPVSLKVVQEPFYRKGFSPFVNKQTGTWWEYDDDKKGFFDTGIIAQGRDGDTVDVRIDGKSIVQDGVADIPKATNKTDGVIKVGYGLQVMSDGSVRTVPSNDTQLRGRTEAFNIISPYNFDRMLKYGMCDGKGEAWTAEEQAAARERMGIDKFEEIAIITLAEDSTPIIDLGAEYGKLFIMFEIPAGDTCIGSRYIKNQNNHNIGFFPSGSVFQSSARFATSIISRYGDYWTCDTNYGSNNNASHLGSNRSAYKLNDAIITQLTFSNSIRLGSKISIYGVRV